MTRLNNKVSEENLKCLVCFPLFAGIQTEILASEGSKKRKYLKDDAAPSIFLMCLHKRKSDKQALIEQVAGANER